MGLKAVEVLDIIEIVFFVPALLLSVYVVYKHGARKQLGWRFLVLICLFRLIGAVTNLISVHHPSNGLTITYDVTNSFGLSAIISTALGLLDRVENGIEPYGLPRHIFRILHLPGLAGMILSIIGSTNVFSSNPSDVSTGFTEMKVAICLFLSVFIADILITGHCFFNISHIPSGERGLLFAVAATLPFISVRMIYALLCVFAKDPKWFSSWSLQWTAIVVHGVMGVLMEAIVVTIYICAGFMTARLISPAARPGASEAKVTYDLAGRSA